jgi:hypothetical protein
LFFNFYVAMLTLIFSNWMTETKRVDIKKPFVGTTHYCISRVMILNDRKDTFK